LITAKYFNKWGEEKKKTCYTTAIIHFSQREIQIYNSHKITTAKSQSSKQGKTKNIKNMNKLNHHICYKPLIKDRESSSHPNQESLSNSNFYYQIQNQLC